MRRKGSPEPDAQATLYLDEAENPLPDTGLGPVVIWYTHGTLTMFDPFSDDDDNRGEWVNHDGSPLGFVHVWVRGIRKTRSVLGCVHPASEQFAGTGFGTDGQPIQQSFARETMNYDEDFAKPDDDLVIMPESVAEIPSYLVRYWGTKLNGVMAMSKLLLRREGYSENAKYVRHVGGGKRTFTLKPAQYQSKERLAQE